MAEKKAERESKAKFERAEHLRDLQVQEQMFQRRQQGLENHLKSIHDRDDILNKHFNNPAIITATKEELVKNDRANKISARMQQLQDLRDR